MPYKNKISNTYVGKRNAIFILILVFSFPLIAVINYAFEIKGGTVSFLFRLVNLIISFWLILEYILRFAYKSDSKISLRDSFYKIRIPFFLFMIFWGLYILRIVIDLEVYDLNKLSLMPKSYYYLFTFGITIIPMTAIVTIEDINFNYLKKVIYSYTILLNICFLIIFILDKFYFKNIGYRFLLSRNGFDYLDAITIAIYSGLLIIFSFLSKEKSIYDYIFIFIGSFILLATASRGPVLFVFATLLFSFIFKNKGNFIKNLYLLIVIVFAAVFNFLISIIFHEYYLAGNPLFHRLGNFETDQSTVNRFKIIYDSINQYLESPFFGSHFLVIKSEMYSHNILLDILLSTGFLGLLLVFPIFLVFAKKLFSNKLPNFILVVGVYFFLNTLTSGACYNMAEFWLIFVFIIAYKERLVILNK